MDRSCIGGALVCVAFADQHRHLTEAQLMRCPHSEAAGVCCVPPLLIMTYHAPWLLAAVRCACVAV